MLIPNNFKKLVKNYAEDDVEFTEHAKNKLKEMPFNRNFVIKKLFDINKLIYEEFQENRRTYKLIYEHSARYSIVIVVSLTPKSINIVTAYKTSKKIQKLLKKMGTVYISKRF